jgi:undecaprenyl diphosphate synthase
MSTADELLARIRVEGVIPRHVAIIMDGNGRWATERHLPRALGHRSGMKAVRAAVQGAIAAGVEVLSLFAFSRENWERPAPEVTSLMSLLEEYIAREGDELHREGVQVRILGELDRITPAAAAAVKQVIALTAGNQRLVLNLFISYGSRSEIIRAARAMAAEVASGEMESQDITEESFASRLYTAGLPDPDLLIRTSGEQRLSNFLLWQLAYSELHMTPVLWPDFRERHLYDAIIDFQGRERRFGRVTA